MMGPVAGGSVMLGENDSKVATSYNCCSLKADYSVVPHVTWGTLTDDTKKKWWTTNNCDNADFDSCKATPAPTAQSGDNPTGTLIVHKGFDNVSWWNPKLWTELDAAGISCNPAKCGNPAACNIPNCTLILLRNKDG